MSFDAGRLSSHPSLRVNEEDFAKKMKEKQEKITRTSTPSFKNGNNSLDEINLRNLKDSNSLVENLLPLPAKQDEIETDEVKKFEGKI